MLLLGVHAFEGAPAPRRALAEARRVPGAAQAVSRALDRGAVLRRRDEIVHHLDDSALLPWLEERGIVLYRGWGRLDGERRVIVGEQTSRGGAAP